MSAHEFDNVSLQCIQEAAERTAPFVKKTPVLRCSYLNELSGRNLAFKCELFQKTGSFKFRGACNAVARLKSEKITELPTVVTHSSGNHGQALCLAAHLNGLEAIIVCPSTAPQVKKNAMKSYNGIIVECAPSPKARAETAEQILRELGERGEYVPSADHPFIYAGQGTSAIEFLEQVPDLDAVVVCCSTGGLIAGVATACKSIKPDIKIYAAEPELAGSTTRSLQSGQRYVHEGYPDTIADGLRMSVGRHTWPVIQDLVDDGFLVSEEEIIDAMFLIYERMKVVVEPSGAVPLAAVLSRRFQAMSSGIENIGVYMSGGNLDLRRIPWML